MYCLEIINNIFQKFSKLKKVNIIKSSEKLEYTLEEKESFYFFPNLSLYKYQVKSTLKIIIIIILFAYKLFYPTYIDNKNSEYINIESKFP